MRHYNVVTHYHSVSDIARVICVCRLPFAVLPFAVCRFAVCRLPFAVLPFAVCRLPFCRLPFAVLPLLLVLTTSTYY